MNVLLFIFLLICSANAQEKVATVSDVQKVVNDTLYSKWYEKLNIRGYAQFRYNRLFETNQSLKCPQ